MNFGKLSDIELITLLKADSKTANEAFNVIYKRYSSQVYGYCLYRMSSRDDADELMQDCWMRFFQSAQSGKSAYNILPLLFTIARNLAINKYKHTKTQKYLKFEFYDSNILEQFASDLNHQSEMEKDEIIQSVRVAVNCLEDKYKDVILLYWFSGLKFAEIAQISGDNEGTVRKRFERAMKKIDDVLKPYLIKYM